MSFQPKWRNLLIQKTLDKSLKNFCKTPNSLAFRTPRWFIKSARDKFAGKIVRKFKSKEESIFNKIKSKSNESPS